MLKQIPTRLLLFMSTLRRLSIRVFFAVLDSLLATPVFFYTRAGARARTSDARVGSARSYRQLVGGLLLGVGLLFSLGFNLLQPLGTMAATSDNLNFQARLERSNGAIAPDGIYNVEFKLYSAASGGSALWTEDYLVGASQGVRVTNGYLTVNLGSITSFPSTIAWDQDLYITMNIGGTANTVVASGSNPAGWDGEMNPRLQLTSVPYAFQAKSASQLQVSNSGNIATLSFTTPTANRSILLPDASGTVCLESASSCGFALASGSNAYIQNGTSLQGNANFNIQTVATGSVTAAIQALTGQTADLLQFRDAAGTGVLSGFNASGQLYFQSGSFVGALVQNTLTTSTNYHLPDTGGANEVICLVSTCTGGAGGSISSSGTKRYSAKMFDSASHQTPSRWNVQSKPRAVIPMQ